MDTIAHARRIIEKDIPSYRLSGTLIEGAIEWLTQQGFTVSFSQADTIKDVHLRIADATPLDLRNNKRGFMASLGRESTVYAPFKHLLAQLVIGIDQQRNDNATQPS